VQTRHKHRMRHQAPEIPWPQPPRCYRGESCHPMPLVFTRYGPRLANVDLGSCSLNNMEHALYCVWRQRKRAKALVRRRHPFFDIVDLKPSPLGYPAERASSRACWMPAVILRAIGSRLDTANGYRRMDRASSIPAARPVLRALLQSILPAGHGVL
jgi:hypothetical protein